ncbi:hypothetical protein Btru_011555 [Bulinus truncatus]|nr:hypothetical protein Btru_011555 [Bulinus truncatus]
MPVVFAMMFAMMFVMMPTMMLTATTRTVLEDQYAGHMASVTHAVSSFHQALQKELEGYSKWVISVDDLTAEITSDDPVGYRSTTKVNHHGGLRHMSAEDLMRRCQGSRGGKRSNSSALFSSSHKTLTQGKGGFGGEWGAGV